MANEQQQTQPQVAIPLPKGKTNAVQIGCICMMLSVAMYGLVFATLTSPILESVNAMGYVSLFSIFAGMGVSIMTPIGGKLGDLIGRRNIVVIPGIICAVCGIAFAFVRSLVPLMILRLLIGFAQGAFTAAPYIIAGLINERKDVPKAMGMLATAIAVGGFGGSIIAGILTDMGLLKGKRATCYPDMESEIEDAYLTGAPVATDENIITSQGVGTAIDFALKLIEVLISEEKSSRNCRFYCISEIIYENLNKKTQYP